MSAPPPPLSGMPEPPPRKRSSLATAVIVFSVVAMVTFGLCSVALMSSAQSIEGMIFPVSLVIVAICAIGLVVCGIAGIIKLFTKPSAN